MHLIGAEQPGGAQAINNSGSVVGVLGASAFRWTAANGIQSLAIPAQNTGALAINSLGDVAGFGQIEGCGGTTRPVIWEVGGQARDVDLTGLINSLPSHSLLCNARATGINDDADVVGAVHVAVDVGGARPFAFLTRNGVSQPIGELPVDPQSSQMTEAYDINNNDHVVGTSNGRAFRWSAGAGIEDLNSLLDVSGAGWILVSANAINDAGQIVGYGVRNGTLRAFLLTPTGTFPQ
jgi:probable HAF family extracellular repeat protein